MIEQHEIVRSFNVYRVDSLSQEDLDGNAKMSKS